MAVVASVRIQLFPWREPGASILSIRKRLPIDQPLTNGSADGKLPEGRQGTVSRPDLRPTWTSHRSGSRACADGSAPRSRPPGCKGSGRTAHFSSPTDAVGVFPGARRRGGVRGAPHGGAPVGEHARRPHRLPEVVGVERGKGFAAELQGLLDLLLHELISRVGESPVYIT